MMWHPIAVSFVIATVIMVFLVALLGWRRPNARAEEGALLSAVFLFALLFFGVWASSLWITPWGPVVWEVPWLMLLIIGGVITLLILVATPPRPREPYAQGSGTATTGVSDEMVLGFGVMFWILVTVLVVVAALGITIG